jgi:hypothetical protein
MTIFESMKARFARRAAQQVESFFALAQRLAQDPHAAKPDSVEETLRAANRTLDDLEAAVDAIREHAAVAELAGEVEQRRAALREIQHAETQLGEDRAAAHAQFTQRAAELTAARGAAEDEWHAALRAREQLPQLERQIAVLRDGERAVRERELAQQSREQLRGEIARLEVQLDRDRAELAAHEIELERGGTGMQERHSVDIVDRRRVLTARVERNAQDLNAARAALQKFEAEPEPEAAAPARGRKGRRPRDADDEADELALEAAARGAAR